MARDNAIYNIDEQVYCISAEFKTSHTEVPWNAIAGMRHRLVYDYKGINWKYYAQAILVEVPKSL